MKSKKTCPLCNKTKHSKKFIGNNCEDCFYENFYNELTKEELLAETKRMHTELKDRELEKKIFFCVFTGFPIAFLFLKFNNTSLRFSDNFWNNTKIVFNNLMDAIGFLLLILLVSGITYCAYCSITLYFKSRKERIVATAILAIIVLVCLIFRLTF